VGGQVGKLAARHVLEFKEKPDAARAAAYLATGEYRWNAGMFVTRTSVLLERLEQFRPELAEGLGAIAAAWDTPRRAEVLAERWEGLQKIAIDHAIAEPLAAVGGVAVVRGDFGWDDVGDWRSLAGLIPADADGVLRLDAPGPVVAVDALAPLVSVPSGRAVAVVGIEGAVVVEADGVLLVTTRDAAQKVKEVPAALAERGLDRYL
jgi:mannose-1-phosphate guanylyltransferase